MSGRPQSDAHFTNLRVSKTSSLGSRLVTSDVESKTVVTDSLAVLDGATEGYVLTSDADGNALWQPLPESETDIVADSVETDTLKVNTGATDGYVLTSDVDGNATWEAIPTPTVTTYDITQFSPLGTDGADTSSAFITVSEGYVDLYISIRNEPVNQLPTNATLTNYSSVASGSISSFTPITVGTLAAPLRPATKQTNIVDVSFNFGIETNLNIQISTFSAAASVNTDGTVVIETRPNVFSFDGGTSAVSTPSNVLTVTIMGRYALN